MSFQDPQPIAEEADIRRSEFSLKVMTQTWWVQLNLFSSREVAK
jgi:hypothetical protein